MGTGKPEFVFDDTAPVPSAETAMWSGSPDGMPPLTGERTAPGIPEENYWFQRHVAAYEFAAGKVRGMRVLDAGCGEGYGTETLARTAREVVGVDLERSVVERAARRYPGAHFEAADLTALHFDADSFDAVVTLQVIEHMRSPSDFCAEIARILVPGGLLVMATPNRLTFSPEGIRNPFHTVEFSPAELRALLERRFVVDEMLGTFHGGRIRAHEIATRSSFPERLIETPAPAWPPRLRAAVARVTPADFRIRASGLDRSLDLIAIAHRR